MDKARLGVIAVSAFFLVSIIASSFLYNFQEPEQPPEQLPDTNPLQLAMQASNVPATVALLLPRMQLIAQTGETNIAAIDSAIYSIPGIKSVSSQFILPEQTDVSTGMTYVADVQFSKEQGAEQLLSLIEEKAIFDSIDVFPYALVDVPASIEFINSDLNISRTESIRENETMALILLGTMLGDKLEIEIDAAFVGTTPTNIFAFETTNLSAEPEFNETMVEAEIASLEPKLLLDLTTNYSQLSLLEALEQKIASMQNVSDLNFSKPALEAKISLVGDGNISEFKAADLNSFLQGLSSDVIFYNRDFFRASVFFEAGADLLPFEDSINEKLVELELPEIVLQEPVGHATAEIALDSSETQALMPAISQLLESKGFLDFSLQQPGQISLAEVATDSGSTFAIESGLVDTFLSKPHSVGETAQFNVSYYILREKIASIGAAEVE